MTAVLSTTTADGGTGARPDGGVDLGPVDQVPLGEGRAFPAFGQQVAVFRLRDGRVHALGAVCPHRGGPIADGQTDGEVVLCPLHLNAFQLRTGCSPSGESPLPVFAVRIVDGHVVVYPADRSAASQADEIGEPDSDLPSQYPTSGLDVP